MTFEEWMGRVQHRAQVGSQAEALAATRATLETLAERVFYGEKNKLAAQLPHEVGELVRHVQRSEKFGIDEFFRRVSERERLDLPVSVHHARVVAEVLREALQPGAFQKLLMQLPEEFHPLFAGSAGRLAAPRPGTELDRPAPAHRAGAPRPEAGGRAARRARDVMTPRPEPIRQDAPLREAALKMRDLDVGSLPVIDDQGAFVGIVTDRDITVRATADGKAPDATPVEQVMSRDLVCCEEDADAREVARLMRERQVRRVPVVRKGESTTSPRDIVGIVSLGDLATDLQAEVSGETLAEVSEQRGSAATSS